MGADGLTTRLLLLALVVCRAFAGEPNWPIMAKEAFTSGECDRIIELYVSNLERVQDTREAESVSRINRFDVKKKLLERGDLDWIMGRISEHLPVGLGGNEREVGVPVPISSGNELKAMIDFTLLHEFHPGMFFGLHVDTHPNDDTFRTFNVNVMLSDPSSYSGGELQVGDKVVSGLKKGDLYMYPASLPHAVYELGSGLRHTFVMALQLPQYKQDHSKTEVEVDAHRQLQGAYWAAAEARIEHLGAAGGMGEFESKLHLIHAEFLIASGDKAEQDIDKAYCKSYKATDKAKQYAQHFYDDGMRAVQQSNLPGLNGGASFFIMAACIDPTHVGAANAIRKIKSNAKFAMRKDL